MKPLPTDIVFLAAKRTPFGTYGGSLKDVSATVQGGTARAAVPMAHPAAADQNAEQTPAQVRFSVRFGQDQT